MNAAAIIALIEQLLPAAIALYKQLAATIPGTKPVEQILAAADANWDLVKAAAEAEIAKAPVKPA